ncbi:MAG: hypothetical protein IT304_08940 [Dehalococcoidia bacterium]|nr:hypothetical protein [Dehalococcoidia bacterium]
MIVVGSVVVLAIFLAVGWAVATEMFQQRSWRRRVESGDVQIVAALIEESLGAWRIARPPRGTPANLWAGVQGAQLLAVTEDAATLSASAEGEFRTDEGRRVQVATALEEATALAAKLIDMMLYDVPNLRLGRVRVDVYSTFMDEGGVPVQRPILSSAAGRAVADALSWEAMTPAEVLGRFETKWEPGPAGQGTPIPLDPVEGEAPKTRAPAEGAG